MNLSNFASKYKKYILSDRRYEKGDLEILDKKRTIRIEFEKYLNNKKVIISKRYHRTGLRYDIINKNCKVYSFDFINGREKNPFFYNFSKSKKMKKIDRVNFSLNFKNLIKLIINIRNQFFWRLYSLFKQEVTTIELLGVDGSGKTFLRTIYQRH